MTFRQLLLSFVLGLTLIGCSQQPIPVTPETETPNPSPVPDYREEEAAFQDDSLPLDRITLPEGFQISLFAGNIVGARSMTLSEEGTLFVGTREAGKVYAIKDRDGNGKADRLWTIASRLNSPNGVAIKDGDLYVAEINRILKFPKIESSLEDPQGPEVVFDGYPTDTHHGWKFIRFGKDDKLTVPVGAPCNICLEEDPIYASITTLDVKTKQMEIIASGIRNTVGFDWHPVTGQLWFTDNGADWLGNDQPNDELNILSSDNQHFGFPYCHDQNLPDGTYGPLKNCQEFTTPTMSLGPHVAALGMDFYQGTQFPKSYDQQIFIAEHGSWNRSPKSGYRVTLVRQDGKHATSYESFAEGWLRNGVHWGRPVDVEVMPDGSLLVSDDFADAIYRITYQNPATDR